MRVQVTGIEGVSEGWKQYLSTCPAACIYHDERWKEVIEKTFGHHCHYLAAISNGRVRGVLPLVEMRSALFGHFMVSLPFVTYGGLAADDDDARSALTAAAIRLAQQTKSGYIELRQRADAALSWACRKHKVALVVNLPTAAEQAWAALSSRLRGKVRKAQRSGAAFQALGPEAAAEFYRVFARNMRDVGTPVYPLDFFRNIGRTFSEETYIFLVRQAGNTVAAAFGLRDCERLQLPWICSDYRYTRNYFNEFLYWSVIEWACGRGFRQVDLGRSTAGGGNHRFKKQWNPQEIILPWYYWTADGGGPPQLNPDNPRFSLPIRLWRRLPLAVTNLLGPRIVRSIP